MSFVFDKAITKIVNNSINLVTDDIRVLLVGAATTADTETEVEFISEFTTLDECNATNYVRKALVNEAVNEDLANNRAEFDADDVTWTALGGAVDFTIQAIVLYKHVTTDADSIPIAYLDNSGASFAQGTNGSDVTMTVNVEGLLQFAVAA